MAQYARKTELVNAVKFSGNPDEIPFDLPIRFDPHHDKSAILTPAGVPCFEGQWLVWNTSGRFSVLSDDEFQAQYDLTEPVGSVEPETEEDQIEEEQTDGDDEEAQA